jgi:uncharacterized delta-60 repeat protein
MIASRKALIVVAAFVLIALGLPWGGNVPAAFAQTISVSAADPTTATQGTYALPVTVKGSGFKRGAKAAFLRHDNSLPGGITVTGTRYISSTQLVATVDVAPDATFDVLFDIQVTNADGRTGKGTELFKVTQKIDPCAVAEPVPTLNPYTSGVPGLPGAFDSTFGMDGTGKALGPRYLLGGSGIAVQSIDGEGRYVVAGHLYDPCVNNGQSLNVWAVARYLSDGSLDTSFGATPGTGIVTTPFSVSADARHVLIDGDNRIVVVGYAPSSSKKGGTVNVPTVVRYFADGRIDTSFGATGTTPGTGIARVPTGGVASMPRAAAFQSDGKIVIAAQDTYSSYLRVSRLTADGVLDTTFNGSGQYLFDKFPSFIGGMAIDSEQRVVVAGDARRGFNYPNTGTLWRFTTAGVLDQDFGAFDADLGTAGLVFTKVNGLPTTYESVAVDGSALVVTGEAYHPDKEKATELVLARYDTAGTLLWQIVVPCDVGEMRSSWGLEVAIQPDGRILVGGNREVGNTDGDLAIWRFLPDGSLDGSFGGPGWVVDPVTTDTGGHAKFSAFVQQPDGKLTIVGDVRIGAMQIPYMYLARLWQ